MGRLRSLIRNKTMLQHLSMYLCIALTVIVLLLPIYFIACGNAERIMDQEQAQHVSKGFWEIASSLKQCQNYAYNLSLNTDIMRLALSGSEDPDLALRLYDLMLYQKSSLWDNSHVQEIIVQFARNNSLITSDRAYQDKRTFYGDFFRYDGLTYEDWQKSLFAEKSPARGNSSVWLFGSGSLQAISYNYYYPSSSNPLIVISVILPSDALLSELMTNEIQQFGKLTLTCYAGDEQMTIEYDSGHATDIALLSLSNSIPRLGLSAGISHGVYAQATYPIRYTLIIYFLAAFLIALVLSIVFTRMNVRPLEAVVAFISQLGIYNGEYRGNVYAYIRQALAGVTHSEEKLKQAYELVQSSFEQMVFNMAIKDLNVDTGHLYSALGHVPALNGAFVLVGVSCDPLEDDWPDDYNPDIAMVIARRLFLEQTVEPYIYESDFLYIALNVEAQGGREVLESRLENAGRSLGATLGAGIRIGVSREFSALEKLGEAANQVIYALKTACAEPLPPVVWYETTAAVLPALVPINKDVLEQLLVMEDEAPFRAFYGSLIGTVADEPGSSSLQAKTLYYSVLAVYQGTLARLSCKDGFNLKEYNPLSGAQDNMRYLYETGLQIRSVAGERRRTQKSELTGKVLEYIREQYASTNLCLTMVADHFELSERYLSALIREQTGRNYSDHVEDIRMAEAKRLLAQTHLPVNDIAGCVGYDRPNSFYKSFKRYTGMSPKQFRTDI